MSIMKSEKAKYTAQDIAKWFLYKNYAEQRAKVADNDNYEVYDGITHLKLQKLLYNAQGVYLAIKNKKLFDDDLEAWDHGPVVREVYDTYCVFGRNPIIIPATPENDKIVKTIEEDKEVKESPMFKGGMMMHAMDTCVVEVAADGKTAKGCWISPGHESVYIPDFDSIPGWKKGDPVPENTPLISSCEWAWSKYQVDFIEEDGVWKFWKLRLWPIYKTDFYVPWTEHPDMDPVDFPFKHHKDLPQMNWAWSADSVYPANEPEPPLPYDKYENAVPTLWKDFV